MQHAAYCIKRYSLKLKAISVPGSRYMLHTAVLYSRIIDRIANGRQQSDRSANTAACFMFHMKQLH